MNKPKGIITNMTKKIIFLTTLLFTLNALMSSGSASSFSEKEDLPDWSRTFNLIQYNKVQPNISSFKMHFSTLSRNSVFMMVRNGDIHAVIRKKDGPLVFKKGVQKFGLIPFQDCELSFNMSTDDFFSALCVSFNVARF